MRSCLKWSGQASPSFSQPRPATFYLTRAAVRNNGSVPNLKSKRASRPKRFDNASKINPASLRETLAAHREANRASVIHWTIGKGHQRTPIQIPLGRERVQDLPEQTPHYQRHVKFERVALQPSLDYVGKRRPLTQQWTPRIYTPRMLRFPWLYHLDAPASNAKEQLQKEIAAFGIYMSTSSLEDAAAVQAQSDILAAIQCVDEGVHVDVVGSRGTGLATALSDVDLNVLQDCAPGFPKGRSNDQDHIHLLATLSKGLRRNARNIRINMFIRDATVPVITGVHLASGLEFQIQSTADCFVSTQYVKDWLIEFPTLRALLLVIKQLLKMRNLCNGASGGLTTYPLLGMIVVALKFSEGQVARDDVAGQLLFFLDMFCEIDFYTTAISSRPLKYVKKIDKNQPRSMLEEEDELHGDGEGGRKRTNFRPWIPHVIPSRPFLMSVQDPANPHNDLGRGVFLIKNIQATLIELRHDLHTAMADWDLLQQVPQTTSDIDTPLLASMIGGDYTLYQDERRALEKTASASLTPT